MYLVLFTFHLTKPLPAGVSVEGPARSADGMEFLYDLTYQAGGERKVEQMIFDHVFSMIEDAEEFVVIDMFLFRGDAGEDKQDSDPEDQDQSNVLPLASELTDALVKKKRHDPDLKVWFITDELNNFYGAYTSREIERLIGAGIEVIPTRMERLRDSNPVFSAAWRVLFRWLGTGGPGWLPDFINKSGQRVTVRSYLKMLNFKANHRKLIVTENGCLITSANPHDASGLHSNIGFTGRGSICGDFLAGERAVAVLSGGSVEGWPELVGGWPELKAQEANSNGGTVQLLTEGKIREALLADLAAAGAGDRIDLAMFYLSERKVVEGLLAADARGASVRLILDLNRDAFGHDKNGIPNRPVARELVTKSDGRIQVKWYDTRGEQFHTKLVRVARADSVMILGGSANLTRRNISDYNLEADLRFAVPKDAPLAQAVGGYLEKLFLNQGGDFTLPFEARRDNSRFKRVLYRVQEFTGLCTF